MRIIVFGAGAVGSVIGGRLHQGGADVVLVARPAHAAAVARDGLLLRTGEGEDRVAVAAVDSIAALVPRPDDVILITAKTQDTPAIHDALAAWNPGAAVVCGTNGVEHERAALRRFEHVYAMVVQLPATFESPGAVTALCTPTNALIDLGRYPAGVDATATEFAGIASVAPHLSCETDPDVMAKKYAKILVNLGNAAEAAIGPKGRFQPVVTAAQEEGRAVFSAAGIRTSDDLSDEAAKARYAERMSGMQFRIPPDQSFLGGSTWQSLAKGATTVETDYFNGEIVLLGRMHGVATPHNAFLQHLAHDLVRRRAQPGAMSAEELEQLWSRGRAEQAMRDDARALIREETW